MPPSSSNSVPASARQFATTRWTAVLTARKSGSLHATEALDQLCRTYWCPLYAWVRRQGYPPHNAQDLIQGFIAVKDIRYSQGRIVGLPLAVMDALLFPLLCLDALIVALLSLAFRGLFHFLGPAWIAGGHANLVLVALLGIGLCVLVDYLIIRGTWQALRRPVL